MASQKTKKMPMKVVEEQEWEDEAYYSDSSSLESHSRSPPYSELNHSIPSKEDHPDDINIAPAHMATAGGNNNASRANNNARPSSAPPPNTWGA